MWRSLIRATEWQQIVDLAAPSFFEVLPGRELRRASKAIAKGWLDTDGFAAARDRRASSLCAAPLDVQLGDAGASATADVESRGRRLLALYFHQLLEGGPVLLDLRPERFTETADALVWDPKPLWYRFDEEFLGALRDVYAGFYAGDDARFDDGIERLELECARDTFLEHFGGEQDAVEFRVASFTDTFHRSFASCRDAGVTLHRDFVALGLYLATLYVHLEELGGAHDVAAAFERARSASPAREAA